MRFLFIIVCSIFFVGCANLKKPDQVVSLPDQNIKSLDESNGIAKVVLFNRSNKIMFGPDGTGRINISLDGESVGQLNIGEYLIMDISPGEHVFDLVHKDIWLFSSQHKVFVEQGVEYIKIYAKVTSNGLEVVARPENLESDYKKAY